MLLWCQFCVLKSPALTTVPPLHPASYISGKFASWLQRNVNSSPPSATYMRRWTESALIQIMACRLDGAKPLSEPMLTYCQLCPKEHTSMKFYLKFKYFHSTKCVWTCRLQNIGCSVQGEILTPMKPEQNGWHLPDDIFMGWFAKDLISPKFIKSTSVQVLVSSRQAPSHYMYHW